MPGSGARAGFRLFDESAGCQVPALAPEPNTTVRSLEDQITIRERDREPRESRRTRAPAVLQLASVARPDGRPNAKKLPSGSRTTPVQGPTSS